MAASYSPHVRPLTHPKRVKLVSTCDSCKTRKVRCDKERPCGACKKSNKICSYEYSLMSIAIRESGGRARPNWLEMQEKLNSLQSIQEKRIDQPQNFIYMALRDSGVDVHASQEVPGMPGQQNVPVIPVNETGFNTLLEQIPHFPPSTDLAESVLQHSTKIASQLQRTEEQYQYDPTYFLNSADFAVLAQQVPTMQSQTHFSPDLNQNTAQDQPMTIAELALAFEEMNLYQSTRYIGEGSLLLVGDEDDNGEKFIPQPEQNLSNVTEALKVLPDHVIVNQLIILYYKNLHRYAPFLRPAVVDNALKNLSKPQHLLLLNCIFFAASPFHADPEKRDGRIYFERAEGLLYKYCRSQPHVLTVIATVLLGLHNKQPVSGWMYNGIATKMLFELGLHRKMKNVKIKMVKEVAKLRSEAFWMTFISENFVSAAYGRPNMIEESDCDVELPELPLDGNPSYEESRLQIAFFHWITLSRICVRVRKYLHAASRMKFLVQEDENKFRILDTQLGNWFISLPEWLKFQNMVNDSEISLLNGIGGDLNIFFFTVLILLHSRHLRPSGVCTTDTAHQSNSLMICTQAASIIVKWLDILLERCPDFFSHSVCGPFAINPAMRVFRWSAEYVKDPNNPNDNKALDMVKHLKDIEGTIFDLSRKYDRGREHADIAFQGSNYTKDWLGLSPRDKESINEEFDISRREGEVFIADNDYAARSQYRCSWRQGSFGFGRRKPTRGMSGNSNGTQSRQMSWTSSSIAGPSRRMSSNSSKSFNKWLNNEGRFGLQAGQPFNDEPQSIDEEDLNFTFVTDHKYEFSAFQSSNQNGDEFSAFQSSNQSGDEFSAFQSSNQSEVDQKDCENLYSPEPETYLSQTQSSYTPTIISPTPSSISEFQEQRSPQPILHYQHTPPQQLVRPQEIEQSSHENGQQHKNHVQGQNQQYFEYPQSQLPMTPPQQNYPDSNRNGNRNYINDSLNSVIFSPPQNFPPLRTSSNSSSISAMLTPPLGPNDECLYGQSLNDLFEVFDDRKLLDNPDPLNLVTATSTGNNGGGGNERDGSKVSGLGISVGQQGV